jgi:hypothetical protein
MLSDMEQHLADTIQDVRQHLLDRCLLPISGAPVAIIGLSRSKCRIQSPKQLSEVQDASQTIQNPVSIPKNVAERSGVDGINNFLSGFEKIHSAAHRVK